MKQRSFFESTSKSEKKYFASRKTHGGTSIGRKLKRPLVPGKWTHLILKSDKAKGTLSFLTPKNQQIIREVVRAKSKKFGIRIKDDVNMGNHLHMTIKFSQRENFQKFLKSITALIARKITGAKKGKKFGRFWQDLAFTRVVTSALELLQLTKYFQANRIQRDQGQKAREEYLDKVNRWIKSLRIGEKSFSSA